MAWKLKTTEEGAPVLAEGIPVYIDDTGKETPIDPNQMHNKILELNSESKSRREKIAELQGKLKPIEGIDNLDEFVTNASKALETVQNLEDAQLVQAGEVEKIKADAKQTMEMQEVRLKEQFQGRETELKTELQKRDSYIRELLISSQFSKHSLFSGQDPRTHLDPDVAESHFGKHFDVEDHKGKPRVVGKDLSGNVILSKEPNRFGEPAHFEEAMEIIFAAYPGKDRMLRAGPSGSGSAGGKDGITEKTPLAVLQQQYDEAQKAGQVNKMMKIKRRIHALRLQTQ